MAKKLEFSLVRMLDIHFEDIEEFDFELDKADTWLRSCCVSEGKELGDLNAIFCSDDYLLEMNKTHLDHDYYTDIITFDYCKGNVVSGDLFISIDRVEENASSLNVEFVNELHRVLVHGVLHLCGYSDSSEELRSLMRHKENDKLNLLS
jgi:probable rRNA maturation factor